jgi:predicted permease
VLVELLSSGQLDPLVLDVKPNANVILFTSMAAVVTALCFGIAPALTAATSSPAFVLNDGSFRIVGARGRLASMLVIFQVGVSLLLLVAAGLFLRSLHNLRTLDPGFRHEGVLIVHADGARAGHTGPELMRLYDELQQEVSQIPGVRSAGFSQISPPSGGGGISLSVRVNDQQISDGEFHVNGVSPRYFETMATPVLAGREFTRRDDGTSPKVAIVNQTFAERYLDDAPLGQRITFGGPANSPMEIVGVVEDAVYETLRAGAPPTVYFPVAQRIGDDSSNVTFEINTDGGAAQVAPALQQAFQRRLPRTLVEVRTLTSQIERTLVQDRLMAMLAASFGGLGLILAAIGLYGLLAYLVARRTNEIGVRMALGATQGNVIWTVMRGALTMLALGAAFGLPIAWSAGRLVASMLFGVEPFDASITLGATATLIAAGSLAAFVPAYRAASVDPMIALRHD